MPNKKNQHKSAESLSAGRQAHKSASNEKIKLGWFTFSCSGDNTVIFTELLNDYWKDWKKIFDFRNVNALRTKNVFDKFDIAIIEGAITSKTQAEKLKEIRKKSKKLIAVGSCAVTGMPAGQRNFFTEEQKKRIQFLLDRFAALPKVLKASEVVKVDAEVPGCPMDSQIFLEIINKIVKAFQHA